MEATDYIISTNDSHNTEAYIHRVFSFDVEIPINRRTFLNKSSLDTLNELILKKFQPGEKTQKEVSIHPIIDKMERAGYILLCRDDIIFQPNPNKKKTDIEIATITSYLNRVLPEDPENPGSWSTYKDLSFLIETMYLRHSSTVTDNPWNDKVARKIIAYNIANANYTLVLQLIDRFKSVVSLKPAQNLYLSGAHALCTFRMGDIDTAIDLLEKGLKHFAKLKESNYRFIYLVVEEISQFLFQEKQIEKEARLLEAFLKFLNNDTDVYNATYSSILQRYHHLIKIIDKYEALPYVKKELSKQLYHKLQLEYYKSPNKGNLLNEYALIFKNTLNDFNRAEECYSKIIELDKVCDTIYSNYALLHTSIKGDDETAEKYYLKALNINSQNETLLGNYAFFLQNVRKDFSEAESLYKEALRISPSDQCILNNYATLRLLQGDIVEAESLALKSLELCLHSPNRILARTFLVLIIIRMFNCKEYVHFLGKLKYTIQYGIDHVCWDNRELMVFVCKVLNNKEFKLIEKIFRTINDFAQKEYLDGIDQWKNTKPIPFNI